MVLATVASALGTAGAAVAASPALAQQYNLTFSDGGAAVPVGTSWSATSGIVDFLNSSEGVVAQCPTSTLSGTTDSIVPDGPSAGLSVTGGTFPPPTSSSPCTVAGVPVTVTGNFSPPWQVTPTSGTSSPFGGTVTHVSVTLACGTATATFSGDLTSGGEEDNLTGGSQVVLTDAGSLTKSGTGCAAVPSTVFVTGTYTLTDVNDAPVSSMNNLWLNFS